MTRRLMSSLFSLLLGLAPVACQLEADAKEALPDNAPAASIKANDQGKKDSLGAPTKVAETTVDDSAVVKAFGDYAYEPTLTNLFAFEKILKAGGNPNALRYGEPLLFDAQTVYMARVLIEAGADVKMKGAFGKTALIGKNTRKLDVIQALLAAGADPQAATKFGETPLHFVCERSYAERDTPDPEAAQRIALLRPQRGSIDDLSGTFGTPLLAATSKRNPDCVKAFIAAGANPDAPAYPDQIGDSTSDFQRSVRQMVLKRANEYLDSYDEETIKIFKTVGVHDPALVREDSDAEVIRAFSKYRSHTTPENLASFAALLKAGHNPNAIWSNGPFLFNVPNVEMAKLLIAAGANVKARNRYGDTVLTGENAEKLDVIKVLLGAGADTGAVTSNGTIALHYVCGRYHESKPDPEASERIALLRPKGGSLDAHYPYSTKDTFGTPLMLSASADNPDCVKALIAAGANPDAQAYPDSQVKDDPAKEGSVRQQVVKNAKKHPYSYDAQTLKIFEKP